jgi:hypothetical protein
VQREYEAQLADLKKKLDDATASARPAGGPTPTTGQRSGGRQTRIATTLALTSNNSSI